MIEKGQVIEILPDNYAKILMKRSDACEKCKACAGSGNDMIVVAYNPDAACVSQWVSLSLESKYFLSAVFILYGLPLLSLLIGTAAGYYGAELFHFDKYSPLVGLIVGIVLTLLTYRIIKRFDHKIQKSYYTPTAHTDISFFTDKP